MPLDCVSAHKVFIHDRGGVQRLWEITNLNFVQWGRVRDDISEATVKISAVYCDPQSSVLNGIMPGRHEMVIYRGEERVWEGPLSRVLYTPEGVNLYARDVCQYLYFTAMHAGYSNAYPNVGLVTDRIENIIRTELARKEALDPPVNVLPWLLNFRNPVPTDGPRTAATTVPMQYTVWEHLDNLAANNGIDYTAVGRRIILWDTHIPLSQTQTVTEVDFLGGIEMSVYGMELGTHAIVTDGQGNFGETDDPIDPYYGEWERLATAYDEDTDDGPPPTQAAMKSQAERNLAGRNPTPLQVRIPDNSGLNPNGVLSMKDLIPGVWVPLRATLLTKNIAQMQKVDTMTVTEDASSEAITASLYPAAGNSEPEDG